jgi:hypothetical protein
MKKIILLLLIITGCNQERKGIVTEISLGGNWQFRIDSLNSGIDEQWFNYVFEDSVSLPGSMAGNGKGYEVDLNTPWVGDIIDKSYFTSDKYEKYRKPGNFKIPFWLKPVKYYRGPAWYQKEIIIPDEWKGKRIELSFERCHWESIVYVNGIQAGSENSLSVPHKYDISPYVKPGLNKISVRINNEVIIPIGVNSHSISDHTQSNWNGITGDISIKAGGQQYINEVKVYPDIEKKTAKFIVSIRNQGNKPFEGLLKFRVESFNTAAPKKLPPKKVTIVTNSDEQQVVLTYKINKPELWSEFNPALYRLSLDLCDADGMLIDSSTEEFGMKEFRAEETRFSVNGVPVFLRGTTECCIFPLTGYPPADYASWEKVLKTCRDYGLNHVRFHSYCPPEAAFQAADRLGIYFQVECGSWANQGSSIGNGEYIDRYIYEESDKILKEYGNHPSFCMLAYGNEPAGRNHKAYLGQLIEYWRSTDGRRVYTSAAGWPVIPESDYHVIPDPRIQQWGQGLTSIINSREQNTMFDFADVVNKHKVPVIGHEIGQWCVYPNLSEIDQYKGVLKATNFEIFRETLYNNDMAGQEQDFLNASGKLQVLCYKADIEAALRTPGFGGFEMLQLHDFPGQGTALVGILNPFFESKGYVTPEEFRRFCNSTVPLARMKKMVYTEGELFEASIELAHFGQKPIRKAKINCTLTDSGNKIIYDEQMLAEEVPVGSGNEIGIFSAGLSGLNTPARLTLTVSVEDTPYINSWDIWVYPDNVKAEYGNVYVTDQFNEAAREMLKAGKPVLLLTCGNIAPEKGAKVEIGYSSIFWNTAWTRNQAPHTLGILCKPDHALFSKFPTEFHTSAQWWDPITNSQAMIIDGFPAELRPLIQAIDTWFENRRLALAFETKTEGGKLMVSSIDLKNELDSRPVSRQLLYSMLEYMNSESFNPVTETSPELIASLTSH